MPRFARHLIPIIAGLFACIAAAGASAQSYPNKPIRLVSPWPAGGPADAIARSVTDKLAAALGQPVVLDSKGGANGLIGTQIVARAPADGYTLLLSHASPTAIAPATMREVPYDPVKDFDHITIIAHTTIVLTVRSDLPARSVAEFIAYARSNPGKIAYGSVGQGSVTHLGTEHFSTLTRLEMLHIPYKGAAPLMSDLLGGRIQMTFIGYSAAAPHIRSGAVRGLGVTLLDRASIAPELPTVAATVPGFQIPSWYGLSAPAGTPKEILARLYTETAKILKEPDTIARLRETGSEASGIPPEAFAASIKADIATWAKVAAAVKLEKQ